MNSPKYVIINKVSKTGYTYQALRLYFDFEGEEHYKDFPLFTNDLLVSKVLHDVADIDFPHCKGGN